jgi:Fe-Mn family superoxide dismutase
MDTVAEQGAPLLCLDLWEHAYAGLYHDKTAYIQSFWKVVNWDFVSLRYNKNLRKGTRNKGQGTSKA